MVLFLRLLFYLQRRMPVSETYECNANNIYLHNSAISSFEELGITDNSVEASRSYVNLLHKCIYKKNKEALAEGKLIHAHMTQRGIIADILLHNTLISMYVKCGSVVDARRVFDQMNQWNVFSWTSMIGAYTSHEPEEALALFRQMELTGVEPNQFTFATVLPACANLTLVEEGMEIHQQIIRSGFHSNVFVMSAIVDMYAKCGFIDKARQVFDKIHERNVVSWTVMISSYARHGFAEEALELFHQMQRKGCQPNRFTFASVLSACAKLSSLEHGVKIHEGIVRSGFQSDVVVANALLDMYAKCGCVDKARDVFEKMPQRNVVTWTAMIAGYAQDGFINEALQLFKKMPQRNAISWNVLIAGCTQNGFLEEALEVFREMPQQNNISWNVIIAGFAQNGQSGEALKLFQRMEAAGMKPDSNSYASILPACANLAALEYGMDIHGKIIKTGFESDAIVVNALLDMYAKCGSIQKAFELFDNMPQRNVVAWTTMISGYAMHGYGKDALKLFEEMKHSGMSPDNVTFICILSACSHAGLVDEGYQYFNSMNACYHIQPTMEHYRCMVDLLGRAGLLDEAQDFINKMPIKPDVGVWICLLGACRMHNNIKLGECIAEHIFKLDPKNSAPYVLLSNIYATAGRWADIGRVRNMAKERCIKKIPGCSWIEVNKQVHVFLIQDR